MKNFKKLVLTALIAAAGISGSAQADVITGHSASLLGETITMSYGGTQTNTIGSSSADAFEVAATVLTSKPVCSFFGCTNFPVLATKFDGIVFDFSANSLTITTPNGITSWGDLAPITFSGFDAFINGISLDLSKSFGVAMFTDVSFSDHSITFDLNGGASIGAGAKLVYNITAVPEPTTVALLGLGLLGFAASRRKSAKA